jgi:hypothetical protein
MNVEIGRQNIIILFWKYQGCAVSFLGIHKSEPDIYIGFSPALQHPYLEPRIHFYPNLGAEDQPMCAADFSLLNLPKGKSLGRSKPATNS